MTPRTTLGVIGCGLMGSQLARTLAAAGREVIVWNRTPEKARALSKHGVVAIDTIAETVTRAHAIILSLATYDGALEALKDVNCADRTIVNLITGTPDEAAGFERWSRDHGARYPDGAILCYPQDIGTPAGLIAYSGDRAVWDTLADILRPLGGASQYVSEQVGGGNVYDVAVAGAFYSVAAGGLMEAAAYGVAAGVPISKLKTRFHNLTKLLERAIDELTDAVEEGRFDTDQATIDVHEEATRSWLATMIEAGQRSTMLQGQLTQLQIASAAGHGNAGFYALVNTAKLSPALASGQAAAAE
jgi:3-hydroxyisobutyrate dehydrogenase-like beta-hydroxyacid dehydrogenase